MLKLLAMINVKNKLFRVFNSFSLIQPPKTTLYLYSPIQILQFSRVFASNISEEALESVAQNCVHNICCLTHTEYTDNFNEWYLNIDIHYLD